MLKGEEFCRPDESCHAISHITSKMSKVKAIKPMAKISQDEYEELEATDFKDVTCDANDFGDMFFYIYNIHVRNWIKNGAKPEDAEFKLDFYFYT